MVKRGQIHHIRMVKRIWSNSYANTWIGASIEGLSLSGEPYFVLAHMQATSIVQISKNHYHSISFENHTIATIVIPCSLSDQMLTVLPCLKRIEITKVKRITIYNPKLYIHHCKGIQSPRSYAQLSNKKHNLPTEESKDQAIRWPLLVEKSKTKRISSWAGKLKY